MMSAPTLNRRDLLSLLAAAGIAGTVPDFASAHTSGYELVAHTDRDRILTAATNYLTRRPATITDFPSSRSPGGLHDFFSQADYFWPDPRNPEGPYINRDGQSNPDNFNDHRTAMIRLSIEVPALTASWLLTQDSRFRRLAGDHLRAWFVTAATRMNPNLEFSQGVHGISTGRSFGIIDTLHLVEVARAARFLLTSGGLSASDFTAIKGWFSEYLRWLNTSAKGQTERDSHNNHAMCWALQAAEFGRFVGDEDIRVQVYRQYTTILLPRQLALNGSFPQELTRTKPYSYSIFNFDVMAALCVSLRGAGTDATTFQLPDGRGLCQAAAFLFPFLADRSAWPYAKDIEYFESLPVRSPGLLFSGLACHRQPYLDLWKRLNPDPADREIIRNFPVRQPLLWV